MLKHRRIKRGQKIGFITGLGLLLVFVAWLHRDDLFQYRIDPKTPFQTYQPPLAPDYQTADAWLRRPDLSAETFDLNVKGDVFVVGPTVFLGGDGWNATLEDDDYLANQRRVVLPNYVLPFRSAGRLFAPHYRQAALYAFLNNRDDARRAQQFAYDDVKRAFEVFLDNNPPERPIVLAGFGQGGLHVERLLTEYFSGNRAQKLAVAYVIQHPFPEDVLDTLPGVEACNSPIQTNCVVAFGQFEPRENYAAQRFISKMLVWKNEQLKDVQGRKVLCVNPLLWTTRDDYAPDRLHLGGVAAEGLDDTTFPAPMPRQTGAQCVDGVLEIDSPRSRSLRRPHQFGGKFKTLKSNLFYEDFRVDSERRVNALIEANVLPRLAPPLDDFEDIEIKKSPITKAGPVEKR